MVQLILSAANVQPFVQVFGIEPLGGGDDLGQRPRGPSRQDIGPKRSGHDDAQPGKEHDVVQLGQTGQHRHLRNADAKPQHLPWRFVGFDLALANEQSVRVGVGESVRRNLLARFEGEEIQGLAGRRVSCPLSVDQICFSDSSKTSMK